MWKLRERYRDVRLLVSKLKKMQKILHTFPSDYALRLSDEEKNLIQTFIGEVDEIWQNWWFWVPPENDLSQAQRDHLIQQKNRADVTAWWIICHIDVNETLFDMEEFKKGVDYLTNSLVLGKRWDETVTAEPGTCC